MLQQALILTAQREYAAMFRQQLALHLSPEARIDVETDPLRALQLSPQQYELILLDTVIGPMDCFQLMSVMKKQAHQTRFVVVSEQANELYRFQAYHNGADLFLTRPQAEADWNEVLTQLGRLLEPSSVPLAAQLGKNSSLGDLIERESSPSNSCLIQVDIIGNSGDIFIYQGSVYHAQCSGLSGERAFGQILSWPAEELRVKVHKLNYVPPRTIERSVPDLLKGSVEVDSLDPRLAASSDYAIVPAPQAESIPTEMATLEAPPIDRPAEPAPAPGSAISYQSSALIGHWKINLMGQFQEGCGPIEPEYHAALTDFIYRKMAAVSVALEEDYFERLTLIGPQYRQELCADNLGVRHALFKAAEISPAETETFIHWCYGQGF